jgi:putative membrane protein insertion efficiency factor
VSAAAHVMVFVLRVYKRVVSPLLPPACRFEPTCSVYAEEAVRRHGARRGTALAVRRLIRCRPGCPGGYDPVPLE